MSQWINFAEIREKVTLADVLFRLYQLPLKAQGDTITAACPIHGGDNARAWNANLTKNLWHCFTHCGGGNQIDFVAKKEKISIRDAGLKLHAFFLERQSKEQTSERPREASPQGVAAGQRSKPGMVTPTATKESGAIEKNPPLSLVLELRADHAHLLEERKLKPETIAHFGVGYCGKGTLRGSIAIPIRDEDGVLVAYAGRRLKPDAIEKFGKYVFRKGFRKELILYNFDRAKTRMTEEGLIIVEGFFAVMALHEAGYPATVAVMGSELSEYQAELAANAKEVILLFDGDEAGRRGALMAREKLKEKTTVRLIRLPEGMKSDTISLKTLRWALNGVRALGIAELGFWFEASAEHM